ncbi:MAG: hypothetical protein E7058_09490 [Lentisphaerae bacterium]|nr:hypothetical protein [Lentisphaerota bacterium]
MVKGKLFSSLVCCAAISLAGAEKPAGLSQLWLEKDQTRRVKLQDQMQELIDRTAKAEFDAFDHDPAAVTGNVLLQFYDLNLDKIKADIPETEVVPGTAVIWYLYNMGFIIKTPTVCFGVDIHHRRAVELADLLDFTVITHNHDDHWSMPLLEKLGHQGKPVVSNFFPNQYYTKAASYTHNIAGVTIYCGEADHNPKLKKFTMPMEIVCPTGDRNFVFFTSGDCWSHEFLEKKSPVIHVYAVHPRNGMKAVNAAGKLAPDVTFIVHLQEMGHDVNKWRWRITDGRNEEAVFKQHNQRTYLPVWGEKILWDGEKINGCQ